MKTDTKKPRKRITVMRKEGEQPKKLRINIGIATIVLDVNGVIIEAMFDPMVKVKDCKDLVSALQQIDKTEGKDLMEQQAELVVATWFNKLDAIEIADRTKFHMVTTPLMVVDMPETYPQNTYPEGSKGHKYLFTFEEL